MKRASKKTDALAPKPVHPRSIRTHGLFGIPYVRQHMVIDRRWTPSSLTEEFKGMTDLLERRLVALNMEKKAERRRTVSQYRTLRHLCSDGRSKLQMSLYGYNMKCIRRYLIYHKELQRLYQRMPIQQVLENINQRTFVMRKERDRLRYRLGQLKKKYKSKLLERELLQDRIKYENEFILIEEKKAWELRKKIENSNVRLKAIGTINGTYKRLIQVLRYDSIFYEQILSSLDADTADQSQFIKHILYIGMPAIAKFKELSEEFRIVEERIRKDMLSKQQMLSSYKDIQNKRNSGPKQKIEQVDPVDLMKRYVRETGSMVTLKNELENIENVVKSVKIVTLCSQAKEIFPRIKSQMDNNEKLHKEIEKGDLGYETLEIKNKRTQVLEGVLINNLSEEEQGRLNRIKELQALIKEQDRIEADTMAYLKNRGDAYVLLRVSIWNLHEILRHVDKPPKPPTLAYPASYLKLPLLKFEMLNMRAVPPQAFDEDLDEIMRVVQKKVTMLMSGVKSELTGADLDSYVKQYQMVYDDTLEDDDFFEEEEAHADTDVVLDGKTMQNIPNRKQMKLESAKIVEELSKKDE